MVMYDAVNDTKKVLQYISIKFYWQDAIIQLSKVVSSLDFNSATDLEKSPSSIGILVMYTVHMTMHKTIHIVITQKTLH